MNSLTKYASPLLFLLALSTSHQALSSIIQFENTVPAGSSILMNGTYYEGGYTVTNGMIHAALVSSTSPYADSYGASGGSDFLSLANGPVVSIFRTEHTPFDLISIDVALGRPDDFSSGTTIYFSGKKSDNTNFSYQLLVTGHNWQTISFADNPKFSDIIEFRFLIMSGQGIVGMDNINVSGVPVPAAAWLFGSGLIGLAGAVRKRKSA